MNTTLLAFFMPGPTEMVVVGIVAVLLFGSRLPTVARSMGQSIMEFRRGFKEVEKACVDLEKEIKS